MFGTGAERLSAGNSLIAVGLPISSNGSEWLVCKLLLPLSTGPSSQYATPDFASFGSIGGTSGNSLLILVICRKQAINAHSPSKAKSFWKPLDEWFRYRKINGFE